MLDGPFDPGIQGSVLPQDQEVTGVRVSQLLYRQAKRPRVQATKTSTELSYTEYFKTNLKKEGERGGVKFDEKFHNF